MKLSTIAATASFLTLVTTKPLVGKHHHNHKRAVVYETVTTEVFEIEYESTTVWVTAGEASGPTTTPVSPPETSTTSVHKHTHKVKTKHSSSPLPAPTTVEAPAPSATAEAPPPPAPTTETPPVATTESPPPPPSATEQPSSTPAPSIPPPSSTPAPSIAPPSSTPAPYVPPPSSTPAPYVPPSSTPAPYIPPPPPSTPPPASPSGHSSSTANCGQIGAACSGQGTYYDILPGEYGACGFANVNGLTDDIIALPHEMMGLQSNGNPFCGRTVSITYNGITVTAKVVDKCGGCDGQSIDLSHHCFDQLAPEGKGRLDDVEWSFTS